MRLICTTLAILLFAVSLRAAPSDAVLARYDVANSIKAIYQDTFVKHLPFESALLVRRDSTDFTSGVRGDVFFACDPDIVAVIHTHPDAGYERPSQQDVRMAVRMKVPIYVVSLHETWVAGADGTIRKVL